jgi:large subunit ribosomal protein L25
MEEIILEVIERVKQPGKFKEIGFVPGVLYGDNVTGATAVKFNTIALKKVIAHHGSNAKVWIKYDNNKKFGFIKEVQKDAISGSITHVDVQIVSKDHEIKLQLPIVFKGDDSLRNIQLQLQVYKSDINVSGKMALLPEAIYVDVSEKKLGDTITQKDLNLDKQINVNENEDEIYGKVINLIVSPDEESTGIIEAAEATETKTE